MVREEVFRSPERGLTIVAHGPGSIGEVDLIWLQWMGQNVRLINARIEERGNSGIESPQEATQRSKATNTTQGKGEQE